jgi:hypothetical protein
LNSNSEGVFPLRRSGSLIALITYLNDGRENFGGAEPLIIYSIRTIKVFLSYYVCMYVMYICCGNSGKRRKSEPLSPIQLALGSFGVPKEGAKEKGEYMKSNPSSASERVRWGGRVMGN